MTVDTHERTVQILQDCILEFPERPNDVEDIATERLSEENPLLPKALLQQFVKRARFVIGSDR